MEFRVAKKQEFDSVRDLYWTLIDETSHLPSFPHWKKGEHPSDEWLMDSLIKSQLFVLEENEKILASVILNNEANESYQRVNWSREVPDEKILIIHVLAVSPKHAGKGLGTKMMQYILDYAKKTAALTDGLQDGAFPGSAWRSLWHLSRQFLLQVPGQSA